MDKAKYNEISKFLSKFLDMTEPELNKRVFSARKKRKSIGTLPEDEKHFAKQKLITEIIAQYYKNNQADNLKRYRYIIDGIELPTTVFSDPKIVTTNIKLNELKTTFSKRNTLMYPQKVIEILRDITPEAVEYIDALDLDIWNASLYRLLGISSETQFSLAFGLSDFYTYRFTSGILPDELKTALVKTKGRIEPILSHPDVYLPLRQALLPMTKNLVDFNSRICAGGVGVVLAMRRKKPMDDYLVFYQRRSPRVSDGQNQLAVIPKAFHQPQFGCEEEEVKIYWTVMRETFEEIYGHEEAEHESHHFQYDWYFEIEPGINFFKKKKEGRDYSLEISNFGLNAVGGNYEVGILIVIFDTDYYELEFKTIWETEKLEHFSSRDKESIKELLASRNNNWTNESIPFIVEGLLRLNQIDRNRVSLPDIQRVI